MKGLTVATIGLLAVSGLLWTLVFTVFGQKTPELLYANPSAAMVGTETELKVPVSYRSTNGRYRLKNPSIKLFLRDAGGKLAEAPRQVDQVEFGGFGWDSVIETKEKALSEIEVSVDFRFPSEDSYRGRSGELRIVSDIEYPVGFTSTSGGSTSRHFREKSGNVHTVIPFQFLTEAQEGQFRRGQGVRGTTGLLALGTTVAFFVLLFTLNKRLKERRAE